MATESNSFEIILKALMDDFGGPEIFSEENEPRLTKALKSIEGLFAKEKKQLLMACMENVPQTMYSAVGLPPKEQQAKVDVCLEKLNEHPLSPFDKFRIRCRYRRFRIKRQSHY